MRKVLASLACALLAAGCGLPNLRQLEADCAREADRLMQQAVRERASVRADHHFNRRESTCYVALTYNNRFFRSEVVAMPIPAVPIPADVTVVLEASTERQVALYTTSQTEWESVRQTYCRVTDAAGRLSSGDCEAARRVARHKMSR